LIEKKNSASHTFVASRTSRSGSSSGSITRAPELAESQRAYAKIMRATLALGSAGRYHTFAFFAADIPSILEPFRTCSIPGKRSCACSARVAKTLFLLAPTSARSSNRPAANKRPGSHFRQHRPRVWPER